MFADKRWPTVLFCLAALCGCPDESGDDVDPPPRDGGVVVRDGGDVTDRDGGPGGRDAGHPEIDAGCTEPEVRAELRFLGDRRIQNKFTDVLGLASTELCNELGRFDCVDIHRVALGGLDPYALGLYEHLPETTATAPIAVDRLAFHGCRERVDRDIAGPVLIFGADRAASIDTLYKRVHGRAPTAEEVAILESFFTTVSQSGEPNPDRSWAILACYSVLTGVESLFY